MTPWELPSPTGSRAVRYLPMVRGAAVYCRISDDREGAGLGVKRQEEDCVALADRKGWPVAQVFVDNDVGAWGSKPRPAYRALLQAVRSGTVDAVIVWHLDRLTRRPVELEEFFEVCDRAGVTALASCTGDVDLSSHDGRFHARILGAVARKESDDKSRRMKRKQLERARAGKPQGGPRAFGFEDDGVTVRESEAALVRESAARALAGETIRSITQDWNARGIVGPRGGRITQTTVKRILTAAKTAGLRSLAGEVVAEGEWPAILDRLTWERLRVVLNARAEQGGPHARSYLLAGFVYCGKCGVRLHSHPHRDVGRTYRCSSSPSSGGCGGIRVTAEPLEQHVVSSVLHVLSSPALTAALEDADDPEVSVLTDDLARIDVELDWLASGYADGKVDRRSFFAASAALEQRRHQRHDELAGMQSRSAVVATGAVTDDDWLALNFDRQRAVIGALIERITVLPATRGRWTPVDERTNVTWRA